MKKLDFITAVANKAGVSKEVAAKLLDAQIEVITETLTQDEEVNITGFGAFKVSNRAARKGVNPKTGESIQIAATKTPTFKAGKTFKENIK